MTTTKELDYINEQRRKKGLPPLTLEQARNLHDSDDVRQKREGDSGFDFLGFLIGYETGVPFGLSGGAIAGALLHDSGGEKSDTFTGHGGDAGGGGASASYTPDPTPTQSDPGPSSDTSSDSSSSSSSSDSSSSSSDSGGGGGDGGGGGGGGDS